MRHMLRILITALFAALLAACGGDLRPQAQAGLVGHAEVQPGLVGHAEVQPGLVGRAEPRTP